MFRPVPFALLLLLPVFVQAQPPQVEPFGVTSAGAPVSKTTLENAKGMRISIIDFGATIVSLEVPDREGRSRNVVLSLPDVASYERTQRRWASVIGRYAGRIDGASFVLDGKRHRLEPGRNGVTLHGGGNGYDRRVWSRRPYSNAGAVGVTYTLASPHGDQGFPGALKIEVSYRLLRTRNTLEIRYTATADAPTVVNLTNHGFLNLNGAAAGSVADHLAWIDADRYAPTDERKIPTGQLASVTGTPLDFRKPGALGERLSPLPQMLAASQGFDHSLIFRHRASRRRPVCVAVIAAPASGRTLEIATTEPSAQLNSGNGFDGTETGSEGIAYRRYAGLALETQHLPDSPNRPGFPSTVLRPGETYRSTTRLSFGRLAEGDRPAGCRADREGPAK